MRWVGEGHGGALRAAYNYEVAKENTGVGSGISRVADEADPGAGKAVDADLRPRCPDHAGLRVGTANDARDAWKIGIGNRGPLRAGNCENAGISSGYGRHAGGFL